MSSRRVAFVALVTILALAATSTTLWAAETAPSPGTSQAPALAPVSPPTQAPAATLSTPAPQDQVETPTIPALSGLPGIQPEATIYCSQFICELQCGDFGGYMTGGRCYCC